ncbi:MAG: hypothetical protein KTR29_10600 [Rhodothermaceae bacterium]|nr:hypothetical protein [Rhodothermaceae bacterium]
MSRLELEHINTLWFMTLGVTAISAGVLVYVLLLESALGAFSIREFYPSALDEEDRPRIAVLASDYTRNIENVGLEEGESSWYDDLLTTWDSYFLGSEYRHGYDWVDDRMIEEDRRLFKYDVLILPSAVAMSDLQIDRVKLFMEQGGGVFASWKTGFLREDGSERGASVISELFNVDITDTVDRYQGSYRSYQAIYPGDVKPGIYVPVNNVLQGIEETEFSPLGGYRRIGQVGSTPPKSDYAEADTISLDKGDPLRIGGNKKAVEVNYFSWLGDRSGRTTPHVYAGFGMESVALYGNTPLTRELPAGYSFFVQVYDPAFQIRPKGPTTYPFGYWKDGATSQQPLPFNDYTSMVYGTHEEGRYIYTGFRRDAMGVGKVSEEDIVHIERFFSNMLQYLRRQPTVWLKDWPAPYSGGALLSGIGTSRLDYLLSVADSLNSEEVKGTFFVEPAQADLYRSTVESLQRYGEVAVLDNYSYKNADPSVDVIQRVTNLRLVLEDITHSQVKSYRSLHMEPLSANIHESLALAGYSTVFADSIERQSVPKVLRYTSPRMTQYSVTAWRDEELLPNWVNGDYDLNPVHKDIERLAQEAGLYQLIYSSEGLARPEYRHLLSEIVQTLKANRYWVATSSEITQWWRDQHGIKATLEQSGDSRLVLHLSNQNGRIVNQVGVNIDIGRQVDGVRIRPELIGSPIPKHELSYDDSQLFIKVTSLKPQQTRLFHIDLIHEDGVPIIAKNTN